MRGSLVLARPSPERQELLGEIQLLEERLMQRTREIQQLLDGREAYRTKMQGQIDELKSQLDASRDLLHRAEADADLQRRERDRLKGQLLESKAQLASMRQQVNGMLV